MAIDPVVNFGKVSVSTGYGSADVSVVLASGQGAKLPNPATLGAFNLVWWNSTDYPDPTDDPNCEIVRATALSTDTLTITRAQEGTSSSTKNQNGKVYKMDLCMTAKMVTDLYNACTNIQAATIQGSIDTTPDFTVILFPDTQYMCSNTFYGTIGDGSGSGLVSWQDMWQWVVAQKTNLNIQAVIGLGDVCEDHDTYGLGNGLTGYQAIIAAGIPVSVGIGNHDYSDVVNRLAVNFATYFGSNGASGNFQQYPFYGGDFPTGSGRSSYMKFTVGSHKYLVLSVQWDPIAADLAWAQGIINANPGYEIWMMTHAYVNNAGELSVDNEGGSSQGYGMTGYNGQSVWDLFVKNNPQIFFVPGGHFTPSLLNINAPNAAYVKKVGVFGQLVHNIFCDYQEQNGGNGYLAIVTVSPSKGTISLSFYSPYLSQYDPNQPGYTIAYQAPRTSTTISTNRDLLCLDEFRSEGESHFNLGNGVTKKINYAQPFMQITDSTSVTPVNRVVGEYADSNKGYNINFPNIMSLGQDYGNLVRFPRQPLATLKATTGLLGGEMGFATDIASPVMYLGDGAWINMINGVQV